MNGPGELMSTPAKTIRNHDEVVAEFGRGWRRPHAHAWDDLLAEDVEVVQPLLRSGAGRRLWQEEMQRLLAFLPDLTGQVTTWAARGQQIFVVLELTATAGGRPLCWRVIDHLGLDEHGRITHRESTSTPSPSVAPCSVGPPPG